MNGIKLTTFVLENEFVSEVQMRHFMAAETITERTLNRLMAAGAIQLVTDCKRPFFEIPSRNLQLVEAILK